MVKIVDSVYSLTYQTKNGISAFWFEYENQHWLVDPFVIINGMVGSKDISYTSLLFLDIDMYKSGKTSYFVEQNFDSDYVYWTFRKPLYDSECSLRFKFRDYIEKMDLCIEKLYSDAVNQNAIVYNGIIKTEEIIKIYEQYKVLKLLFLPKTFRSSEINEEKFKFGCPLIENGDKDWSTDIPYTFSIGNRKISSYISDWSNDMDRIRYQLESYCYSKKAHIELNFEDEPTIIDLQHFGTLASVKNIGPGVGFEYDDFVKVSILPNSFVKSSAITGFCDERETIREIYEGLLNIGRIGYDFEEYSFFNSWDYDSIVFYNHIKSPIIERYLDDIKEKYNSIVERQTVIHHIFTISPDYTHVLGYLSGQEESVDVSSDDVVTLFNNDSEKEICSVTLPGIYEWLDEFNCYSDGVNSTMGKIDTKKWHLRGLILAKELKKKLPKDIDIWYGYPFEDIEHRGNRPFLITEGTLKGYFEEELAIACLKKDRNRIDYCLFMDADINANEGAAFKHLLISEKKVELHNEEELKTINNEKLSLFEYLLTRGLIINAGKEGINPKLELCRIWKCDLIEKRIHEIIDR